MLPVLITFLARAQMKKLIVMGVVAVCSASVVAQWAKIPDPTVPRDAKGAINYDAPTPPDGGWQSRTSPASGCPRRAVRLRGNRAARRTGGSAGRAGAPAGRQRRPRRRERGWNARHAAIVNGDQKRKATAPARGGVSLEPATNRFPFDPAGPPVATFFEAGGNMEGGLPTRSGRKT